MVVNAWLGSAIATERSKPAGTISFHNFRACHVLCLVFAQEGGDVPGFFSNFFCCCIEFRKGRFRKSRSGTKYHTVSRSRPVPSRSRPEHVFLSRPFPHVPLRM